MRGNSIGLRVTNEMTHSCSLARQYASFSFFRFLNPLSQLPFQSSHDFTTSTTTCSTGRLYHSACLFRGESFKQQQQQNNLPHRRSRSLDWNFVAHQPVFAPQPIYESLRPELTMTVMTASNPALDGEKTSMVASYLHNHHSSGKGLYIANLILSFSLVTLASYSCLQWDSYIQKNFSTYQGHDHRSNGVLAIQ